MRQDPRRIRWCKTLRHGSWLDISENELSSIPRQAMKGQRFGSSEQLREQLAAWSAHVNYAQRGVDWQMKVDDARMKLKSIYPKIKL